MKIYDEENPDLYVDTDEDELYGFKTVDRNAIKPVEEEEKTIASTIPTNEQKALVFDVNKAFFKLNDELQFNFLEDDNFLYFAGERACSLKPAFIEKIKTERKGLYAKITVFSLMPEMVKIEYRTRKKDGYVKI